MDPQIQSPRADSLRSQGLAVIFELRQLNREITLAHERCRQQVITVGWFLYQSVFARPCLIRSGQVGGR